MICAVDILPLFSPWSSLGYSSLPMEWGGGCDGLCLRVYDWGMHFSCHRYELGCSDNSALSLSPFLSVADGRSIMVMSMLILLIEFLVVFGCILLLVTLYLLCLTLIYVCVSVCLFYTSISLANSQGKR